MTMWTFPEHSGALLNHHRRGIGDPLALVHGIGGDWQVWQPVLPLLAPYRDVIAVDLPGYGASPRTGPPGVGGIGLLADALVALLDQLGLPTAHLAGNSMGGWVYLELARRGRARTVTAFSPAGFYNDPEAAFARESLAFSVRVARRVAPDADRLLAGPIRRTLLFSQFVGRPWRLPATDAARMMRAFARATGFDADLAAIAANRFAGQLDLTVPVTIGWGRRDRLLLPWQGRRVVRAIPDARLVPLSGVGHVPTHDDPLLVADLLLTGSQPAH